MDFSVDAQSANVVVVESPSSLFCRSSSLTKQHKKLEMKKKREHNKHLLLLVLTDQSPVGHLHERRHLIVVVQRSVVVV